MTRKTIEQDVVAAARREDERAAIDTAHDERNEDSKVDLEDFRRELARSLERIIAARRDG